MVKAENLRLLEVEDSYYAVFDDGTLDDKLQDWLVLDQVYTDGVDEPPAGWEPINDYLATRGLLILAPEVVHLLELNLLPEKLLLLAKADLPATS
jgi:hypothetical protein